MNSFELYFVGFHKHGAVQCLIKGPFVSYNDAEAALSEEDDRSRRSGGLVICKTTLPFEVVDLYDSHS